MYRISGLILALLLAGCGLKPTPKLGPVASQTENSDSGKKDDEKEGEKGGEGGDKKEWGGIGNKECGGPPASWTDLRQLYIDLVPKDYMSPKTEEQMLDEELSKFSTGEEKLNYVIAKLSKIKKLYVSAEKQEKLLKALPLLTGLEDLHFDQSGVDRESPVGKELFEAVWMSTGLKKLYIEHTPILVALPKELGNLFNLEEFTLRNPSNEVAIGEQGIEAIKKLKNLKKLSFLEDFNNVSFDDILRLKELPVSIKQEPGPFLKEEELLKFLLTNLAPDTAYTEPENAQKSLKELKAATLKIEHSYSIMIFLRQLLNGGIYLPNLENLAIQMLDTKGKGQFSVKMSIPKELIQKRFRRLEALKSLTLKGPYFDDADPMGKPGFELTNGKGAQINIKYDPAL